MSPENTTDRLSLRGTEGELFIHPSETRRFDIALATSRAKLVEEQLLGRARRVVLREVYGDFWEKFLGQEGESR